MVICSYKFFNSFDNKISVLIKWALNYFNQDKGGVNFYKIANQMLRKKNLYIKGATKNFKISRSKVDLFINLKMFLA